MAGSSMAEHRTLDPVVEVRPLPRQPFLAHFGRTGDKKLWSWSLARTRRRLSGTYDAVIARADDDDHLVSGGDFVVFYQVVCS